MLDAGTSNKEMPRHACERAPRIHLNLNLLKLECIDMTLPEESQPMCAGSPRQNLGLVSRKGACREEE
jgi:hypothetical protein